MSSSCPCVCGIKALQPTLQLRGVSESSPELLMSRGWDRQSLPWWGKGADAVNWVQMEAQARCDKGPQRRIKKKAMELNNQFTDHLSVLQSVLVIFCELQLSSSKSGNFFYLWIFTSYSWLLSPHDGRKKKKKESLNFPIKDITLICSLKFIF